ncbi:Cleft lip and palate transmembrane protein [Sparassis crispa]|uniref:Cleft lip and palate transmembrane protein n=1 Tax=Sparassis crispa TaxID=139825 RepID=A0A401GCX4_9APHY|nr:Cleft lip and palate transmembrane protein [Sparassis crispa]GBE80038.1 Cleft lip and palate transmembrane protein [Sparassis crispa]
MGSTSQQQGYACRCLNVRVLPLPPPGQPPTVDNDYDSVYVDDDGLSVAHLQLTLRSRTRPVQEKSGETTRSTRYTSLTCLLCQTPVYRVHQIVHPDVEEAEGPVLPTDDWAEQDMLKSTSGWIEVYKGCLTRECISQAENSPEYSKLFSVLLPPELPGSAPAGDSEPPYKSLPQQSGPHLPPLPPLFAPPPFSPADPVFSHLSSIAAAESENIRNGAEEYIANVTQEKVAEVQAADLDLKHKVELLWSKFRETVDKFEGKVNGIAPHSTSRRRRSSVRRPGHGADPIPVEASSVRINDFVPIHDLHPRTSAAAAFPKVASALSASLATSSFHYPHAHRERDASGSSPSPSRSSVTRVKTPSIASSRTAASATNGEGSSILEAFRRNMDESKDIATSFQYVMNMETMMEGVRGRQDSNSHTVDLSVVEGNQAAESSAAAVVRARSPKAGKSSIKKPKDEERPVEPTQDVPPPSTNGKAEDGHPEGSTDKGKRKVTFVVKPEVTIIDGEAQPQEAVKEADEVIFDMEGEGGERKDTGPVLDPSSPLSPKSPTPDSPRAPKRPPRARKSNDFGPVSFAALRPASLPTYSTVPPPPRLREEPAPAATPRPQAMRESLLVPPDGSRQVNGNHDVIANGKEDSDDEENFGLQEAEILRLVAASTPSHRGAWKKNSKAWQLFVNRSERRMRDADPEAIAEEEESASSVEYTSPGTRYTERPEDEHVLEYGDDDGQDDERWSSHRGVASSLPIPIDRSGFGLPSYQLKTSLSDRPGVLVPALHKVSSAAMRKAAYAERDRSRSIDPGALDCIMDEDEEEEEEDDGDDLEAGSRGRQRALQILKARSELPPAGMWRSLA